ncbi:ATP-binding protein [Streptomyces clavifer]|uniref:ATP-binding protein n=1 Tax=Streptomyces clavifer TaxID=68188 RepID=UPI0036A446B4
MGDTATIQGAWQDQQEPGEAVVAAGASTAYDMESGEISSARAFTRDFLADVQAAHGVSVSSRVSETAQLVVSELATNVVKYAPGPCLLDLEVRGNTLTIAMWDSGPVLPASGHADPQRVGQHGLEIVLAVCQSFEIRRQPVGKRIRVQLSLQEDLHDDPAGSSPWGLP